MHPSVAAYPVCGPSMGMHWPGWSGTHRLGRLVGWSGNRVLETLSGDSTVLLGEGQLRSWVYGRGLDEPVLLLQDLNQDGNFMGTHERLWYHTNALGSIVALTDEKGQLVEGYQYDPYGAHILYTPGANGVIDWGGDDVLIENGTSLLGNMYTYTAREWDAETGMLYYRSRYMHPEMGRFIQRDSIGIWGDPVGLGNGYAYVGNQAFDAIDPVGTWTIKVRACLVVCLGGSIGVTSQGPTIGADAGLGLGIDVEVDPDNKPSTVSASCEARASDGEGSSAEASAGVKVDNRRVAAYAEADATSETGKVTHDARAEAGYDTRKDEFYAEAETSEAPRDTSGGTGYVGVTCGAEVAPLKWLF
jgi:RHS repeat-associated protein